MRRSSDALSNYYVYYITFVPVVDIFQSQDRSICGGMNATVTCVTTTTSGLLRWVINNVPVFTVTSGQTDSFSQTINGSEFVFVRGVSAFGVVIYTSTVSLDTSQTTSISCSDSIILWTLVVNFVGKSQYSFSTSVLFQICLAYLYFQLKALSVIYSKTMVL